jgi:hypothetical protein
VKITRPLGNCKPRLAAPSLTALPIRAVFWWLFQVAIVPRQADQRIPDGSFGPELGTRLPQCWGSGPLHALCGSPPRLIDRGAGVKARSFWMSSRSKWPPFAFPKQQPDCRALQTQNGSGWFGDAQGAEVQASPLS